MCMDGLFMHGSGYLTGMARAYMYGHGHLMAGHGTYQGVVCTPWTAVGGNGGGGRAAAAMWQ